MRIKLNGNLYALHTVADLALYNAVFVLSYYLKFDNLTQVFTPPYLYLLLGGNLLWLTIVYLTHAYRYSREVYAQKTKPILGFLRLVGVHMALGAFVLYLSKSGVLYSREFFLTHYTLFVLGGVFIRLMLVFLVNYVRSSGLNVRRYGVIGANAEVGRIKRHYRERSELGYRFCGSLDQGEMDDDAITAFMTELKLDYLYCSLSELNDQQVRQIIRLAERSKTVVKLIPDFKGFINPDMTLEYHGMCPVLSVDNKPISSFREKYTKRAFDLVFSLLVILAGLPVFLVVMVLVKLSSPGPVFFLQERSGQWGRLFKIYKFRTMYVDAEKFGMQHSTGDKDPRITPVGHFLRKTRLDELPQFFNVLKGDMSVVGPRPLHHYDVDMLMDAASHDFQRILTIRPGITSIGQIKVGYATNIQENLLRLRHDIEYLERYSLLTDIRLIALTVQVMLRGRGK
jgi:exopolysaccharide biosynthesis polyprenyl glycosylphosphotransferase